MAVFTAFGRTRGRRKKKINREKRLEAPWEWKLCEKHIWFKENYCRDVCIQCGLVDRYPLRNTSVKNDVSQGKRFMNPQKIRKNHKDRDLLVELKNNNFKNLFENYYTKYCSFLGKRNINGSNFIKFNKFLEILLSFS